MDNLKSLITELCKSSVETEWLEFKRNNAEAELIGRYISALGNSAALMEKNYAYVLWGVDNSTHDIIGTDFDYRQAKRGNEELRNWLIHKLTTNAHFEFGDTIIDGKKVVILRIQRAVRRTIRFENIEYIRVGSLTKSLKDCPQYEEKLWDKLRAFKYERLFAKDSVTAEAVIQLLDCQSYFDLKDVPFPSTREGIIHYFLEDSIVVRQDDGLYSITNLGAILLAKQLSSFPGIARKGVRIVSYNGKDRTGSLKDYVSPKGYAAGYNGLIDYLKALLPSEEVIRGALRETIIPYPEIALREIISNALIHQDLSISGTGPLIELFSNRIEITNPGAPLIDTKRFIDNPPRSRNEQLASIMRQFRICEELGTGWDKIALACEEINLPAPQIKVYDESTKIVLFKYIPFADFSMEEKLDVCYMHACIRWQNNEYITNSTLRERLKLDSSASTSISKLIKEAKNANLIKPQDENMAPKFMKYYPYWG